MMVPSTERGVGMKKVDVVSYLSSVILNLIILALLIKDDVSVATLIVVMGTCSFTNAFTIGAILRKHWT